MSAVVEMAAIPCEYNTPCGGNGMSAICPSAIFRVYAGGVMLGVTLPGVAV